MIVFDSCNGQLILEVFSVSGDSSNSVYNDPIMSKLSDPDQPKNILSIVLQESTKK